MLSWIAGSFFQESPVLFYPLFALAIFLSVYCATAVRLVLFADKQEIEKLAKLPLQEDAGHE